MSGPTKADLAAKIVELINAQNHEPRSPEAVARLAKILSKDELETTLRYYTSEAEKRGRFEPALMSKVADAVGPIMTPEPEPEPEPKPVEPVVEPAVLDDTPGVGVVVAEPPMQLMPRPLFPAIGEWQMMRTMAEEVCRTNIMPVDLRTPAATLLVLLAAHDLVIEPTMAFQKLYVVEGRLTMSAELMVRLILRRGHDIWPDESNDATKATAHCVRKGTSRVVDITFTIGDAVNAELVEIKEGRPYARSRDGHKKLPWELYTADMLWARAVSRAARRRFPDCLAGITYTPEELGDPAAEWDLDALNDGGYAATDTDGALVVDRVTKLREIVSTFDDDEKEALKESWKSAHIPPLPSITRVEHVVLYEGLVDRIVRIREAAANVDPDVITDAEIVEEALGATEEENPMCMGGCGEQLFNGEPLSDDYPGYHASCEPYPGQG